MSKYNLIKLYELSRDKPQLQRFLEENGLTETERSCPNCHQPMSFDQCKSLFRCRKTSKTRKGKVKCDISISPKSSSWFSRSKLDEG